MAKKPTTPKNKPKTKPKKLVVVKASKEATPPKETIATFISSMRQIAILLNITTDRVTQAQFWANDPFDVSEWDLRKAGGFASLKKLYFPADEENLQVKHGSRLVQSHRNKLEKKYGTDEFFLEELKITIFEALNQSEFKLHPKAAPSKAKSKPSSRTIVAHISDTHYGANISEKEMNHENCYNWEIAARRTALFIDQVCKYKPQYRSETDLVLAINGDIIAGQIHNQEWFVDLLTTQFAGTLSILSQAVTYAAQHFKSIRVVCTSGNHGRNVGKADKGRATTHKWDSYESMIYVALKQVLKPYTNVEVIIPESPYAIYQVQGHTFFQTHGDTVINVGNPGNALSMKSINNQVNKVNAALDTRGEKISVLLVGHVHVPTVQLMENGCVSLINGCLSGTDPFAQSIGIFESHPTQGMCEVTKEHAVGDIRLIQLRSADKNAELDKIIAPFTTKF